jgi:CIC family chloride channel protein
MAVLARSRMPLVWILALAAGVLAAYAILLFRQSIGAVQWLWLSETAENIVATKARLSHPFVVFAAPVIGGLVVGLLLTFLAPRRRAEGVADVIETAHIRRALIGWKEGFSSAVITVVSLGFGASAGREGPAVHIGATLASLLGRPFEMPVASRRMLLAAGAAAAVSASFNAPVAGVIFAHEVILGHYALSAFVPTVLAAVVATLVTRVHLGDYPAFVIPSYEIASYLEFPAFALLGLIAGLVAVAFLLLTGLLDRLARRVPMPLWLRPVAGGVLIGTLAIFVPEILGVGYEATNMALRGRYELWFLLLLLGAKMLATAITLASRFGGGVFSPSLFLGAMIGGAFGLMVAAVYPEGASHHGAYALVGMSATAGAVLGAPLSTALIVFELTRDYQITIALLVATSISSLVMQVLVRRSFFHWQLAQRGLELDEGPHRRIMKTLTVADFMIPREKGESTRVPEPFDSRPRLARDDTLEKALRTFGKGTYTRLAVVDRGGRLIGWADHARAMELFNEKLIEASVEEHR